MAGAKSINQLNDLISKAIGSSLGREVETAIAKVERNSIREFVYGGYDPLVYIRRGGKSGLISRKNIEGTVDTQDGVSTLKVSNYTKMNGSYGMGDSQSYLTPLIVLGHNEYLSSPHSNGVGYSFYEHHLMVDESRARQYGEPRDFIGGAIESLKSSKLHVKALELGLKRQKIRTR